MSVKSYAHRAFVSALALGAAFSGLEAKLYAQQILGNHTRLIDRLTCSCGRWTCPDCQARMLCPPGQTIQQSPNSMPQTGDGMTPSTDGNATPAQPNSDPASPQPPSTSANDAAAAIRQNLDFNRLAYSGRDSFRGFQAPEMMGDFFGPGAGTSIISTQNGNYYEPDRIETLPSPGYVVGRLKLAENTSPIPRDRIFLNYSLFNGVPLSNSGVTVNRFTPGFEKTLFDGRESFEFRAPFAVTRDSTIIDGSESQNMEFGNIFMTFKSVFVQRQTWLMAIGTSMTLPTADDTVAIENGLEQVRIVNDSIHLLPFIGGAYVPDDRCFAQWIVQCDVDTNGNRVNTYSRNAQAMTQAGRLTDFTFLYADFSFGCWLYKNGGHSNGLVRGIAPIIEMHYNRSLTASDIVTDGFSIIQNPNIDFDNFTLVGGLLFDIRGKSRLGLGYGAPIGNGADRFFDSELRVTLNRYF